MGDARAEFRFGAVPIRLEGRGATAKRRRWMWLLACCVWICGCRQKPSAGGTPGYAVRGVVERVEPGSGTVLLRHEAVAGLMPAMIMSYRLENPSELSELHRGDQITATLLADKGPEGPTNFRLTELDVIGQARADESAATGEFHVPALGEMVPDFVLLDQSGKQLHLEALRGKVVAMTFIYTRCPVADYCPRMSHNFAQMDQMLATQPALYEKTHLLSVSFDPGYDTPRVLRSYGEAYTGRYTQEKFQHWSFAAPSEKELPSLQHWFDVGVTPAGGANLQHSLSTVIVGADGRVVAFYPTNAWTVDEALAAVRGAVTRASSGPATVGRRVERKYIWPRAKVLAAVAVKGQGR